jgi:MYXO-CTERM domain-containing protein
MVTLNGNDYLDDLAQAIADFHPGDTLEVSGSVTLTDTVVVDHPVVLTGVAPGATLTTAGPVGSMFFVNDSLQLAGLALAPVAATRAIDCADVASVTLTDVDIVGGSAENGGQVHATDCDVTFVRGTFSLGQAELGGSVFVGAGATLTVDGPASFEQNLAVRYANLPSGGAVFVSAGAATFTDVDFAENRSDEHAGGAIVAQYGGALHLTDVDFLSNHAGTDGGALLLWNGGVADMLRGSFDANDAEFGGAVSLANSGNGDSTFTATDVGFTNNSASLGGGDLAIHDDGDTATLSGVDSVGARSSEDGGAYWLDWGTLTVTGGTVRSPRATQDGALFEVEHGAVTVTRTVVCDPEAIDQDGAVVAGRSDSHTTLRNVTVRRAVGGRSGGLFSDGDASVVADHLTLVDAEADPGAVVYATGSSVATLTDALLVTSDLDPIVVAGAGTVSVTGVSWPDLPGFGLTEAAGDPFPARDTSCGPLLPTWGSPLAPGPEVPPQATFPGALGGDEADPAPWVDSDGDGFPALWDCAPTDRDVYPLALGYDERCDPLPEPHSGEVLDSADPAHTGAATSHTGATGEETGGSAATLPEAPIDSGTLAKDPGCGCASGSGAPVWLLAVGLLARRRRR